MRERLGRYEEAPSDELWAKIAARKKDGGWLFLLEPVGILMFGIMILMGEGERSAVADLQNKDVRPARQKTEEVRGVHVKNDEAKVMHEKSADQQELIVPISTQTPIAKTPGLVTENIPAPSTPATSAPSNPATEPPASTEPPSEVIPPYKKPHSKFQLYLSVTPSLSFQKLTPAANDHIIIQGLAARSPMSIKRFGFGIDAGFQKDINKIFGYYGGLSFYHQEQQLTYNYYDKDASVQRVGDEWTFEISRQQHTRTFNYSMTNLGVRAGMLVTLKGEKLMHKFGAGLIYTHSLNSSASYLAYQLSYRNEVRINDRISWFAEPTFIYSFVSKEKLQEPFTLKPYRAGISLGVLYRF